MYTILIAEDDKRLNEIIYDYFDTDEFKTYQAFTGKEAVDLFDEHDIDLVILDIMMPELDGWSVCRRIRKHSDALVVILSARCDEDDKLLGFELGADEYVTKPFSPKVLVARVTALLKRTLDKEVGDLIKHGVLSIDQSRYLVKVSEEELTLTNKEFSLLTKLALNPSRVYTREELIKSVWGYDYLGDGRIIDTNIKTLRKKLGPSAKYLHTIINVGYKFEVKS